MFERTARACVAAGIAKGEVVHADASLIRADVAWESLAVRHVEAIAEANGDKEADREVEERRRRSRPTGRFEKACVTDPDATMATTGRTRRLEPSYEQHAVVDDELGVVLDVEVTTGETNEGEQMLARLDATAETTGTAIGGHGNRDRDRGCRLRLRPAIFGGLERRGITGLIPTKAEPIRSPVPLRRFRYDARHALVGCPRGKTLRPGPSR